MCWCIGHLSLDVFAIPVGVSASHTVLHSLDQALVNLVLGHCLVPSSRFEMLVGCQAEPVGHDCFLVGDDVVVIKSLFSEATLIHFAVFVALEKSLITHEAFFESHLRSTRLKLVKNVGNPLLVN